MIRRITLENYMSHARTIIEPAAGLTVLVGPNNCGKSAVVSALETLCNNASGSYMVRHEEKEARVTVETDDGHTFVWRRQGSTVSYVIDGREINRLNRGVPDDLHKLLRLPKVDGGGTGEPFDIHFGTQKSPIFLLNESESRAALFFASSSDAAILLEMQKRHRNKVNERKRDEKRLKGEILKLDAELAALEPLDGLAESVAQADSQYRDLKELAGQIQTLTEEMEALRAHSVKHDQFVQEYGCLAPLKFPPQLTDTSPLESLLVELVGAGNQLQRGKACCRALESLDPPPAFDDVQKLESVCRTLSLEEKNHRTLSATADCLGRLNDSPAIDDTGSLERIVAELESARLANVALCQRQPVLESLVLPPELEDPKPLAELIRQLEDTFRDIARHEGLMKAAAAGMDELETGPRIVESADAGSFQPGPAERRPRRPMLVAAGGLASMSFVILLFILGSPWFNRLRIGSTDGALKMVDPVAETLAKSAKPSGRTGNATGPSNEANKPVEPIPKAVANPDDKAKRGNVTKSSDGANKSVEPPPNTVAKGNDKAKTGDVTGSPAVANKAIDPTPKETSKADGNGKTRNPPASQRAAEAVKQLRLKEVRRLLKDAEMANETGKYLEAILGFGQTAILYPRELAEVDNPEKVRLKFMDALKGYQTEVKRALEKAAKQKAGDHQPAPKTADPNSQ